MTFRALSRIGIASAFAATLGLGAVTASAQESSPEAGGSNLPACSTMVPGTPVATPTINKDKIIATVTAEEEEAASPEADPEADPEAEETTPSAENAVCSVTVEMVDIDFNPNEFTIPANQPVKLVFHNTGALDHDFNQEQLDIDVDVDPGETTSIVVNVPAGDYDFFCEEDNHAEAGMVGMMHVVEGQ